VDGGVVLLVCGQAQPQQPRAEGGERGERRAADAPPRRSTIEVREHCSPTLRLGDRARAAVREHCSPTLRLGDRARAAVREHGSPTLRLGDRAPPNTTG
jgi:hypothetical protein